MIKSFADKETEKVWNNKISRKPPNTIQHTALRKLRMIDAAHTIEFLRVPPGNRLEALKGDRKGQYSIRINQQWRICFCWENSNATDVGITDYH
jgi:proteic killer suppression protein